MRSMLSAAKSRSSDRRRGMRRKAIRAGIEVWGSTDGIYETKPSTYGCIVLNKLME